ncbi:presenilin family intramembrane aspartyl protease PSH [Salinibaculum rarum]|uniref:presenilin family intramembrane aspartyl protease PSH n=1 Tax=Salinibaculum rarum TaxID=3058903 RepID=UPI00265F955B|nr:presenilin family intramembrane aspartyl protease PSH [Salinibaculum sp. KK48]
MDQRRRAFLASGAIVGLFLVVQLGALAVVEPFKAQNYQFVEDTSDPTNSVVYIGAILVATALMLAAIKLDVDVLLRGFVVFSGAYVAFYVFQVVLPPVVVSVGGTAIPIVAVGMAALLGIALWTYPEWYVIDAAGILMGIGAAGIFGINFGILPALVLLSALAVYDAISVYGTEHMLTLASGVMEMRVPIVLVIPLSLSYSFLDADMPGSVSDDEENEESSESEDMDSGELVEDAEAATGEHATDDADADQDGEDAIGDRDALFIGLGDAVIPTVLVASAAFFVTDVPTLSLPGLSIPLPAGTAMVGTLLGLVVLLWMVLKGRAHAGLPLLNGGSIAGYLVGALASGIPLLEALGLAGFF